MIKHSKYLQIAFKIKIINELFKVGTTYIDNAFDLIIIKLIIIIIYSMLQLVRQFELID
jgi:hypothetical protein